MHLIESFVDCIDFLNSSSLPSETNILSPYTLNIVVTKRINKKYFLKTSPLLYCCSSVSLNNRVSMRTSTASPNHSI